jgi:hypothetical protein
MRLHCRSDPEEKAIVAVEAVLALGVNHFGIPNQKMQTCRRNAANAKEHQ